MNGFDLTTLPRMIDISVVRTDVTLEEVYNVIDMAKSIALYVYLLCRVTHHWLLRP